MKILYSFSGHGHGHGIRSAVVIQFLKKIGHQVKAATYAQGLKVAQEVGLIDVVEIEGYRMYYNRRGLAGGKTLFKFFNRSPGVIFSNLIRFSRVLNEFRPDLIISDFEPFSAYWAKWKDIPLIKINNQSVMTLTKIKIPAEFYPDYLTSRTVVDIFAPRAKFNFVLSFSPELTPIKKRYQKNSFLVPPILRGKIFSLQPKKQNFILVYQTSPVYQKKLIKILTQFSQIRFNIYNLDSEFYPVNNLQFKNFSENEFLSDLANCRAVITNGGFTLISEAIYLGKPILSWPVQNDFEQILNAILLERSSYGKFSENLNQQTLGDFLNNLDFYENNLRNYHQDKNKFFEEKLGEILENIK
ncbi:MAG: MJ1255/VC2487 family glycosyltransferase [Patescibacteria group bacterium]